MSYRGRMTPDEFEMRDLKRRVDKAERHAGKLKAKVERLQFTVNGITKWRNQIHQSWPPPPPPTED